MQTSFAPELLKDPAMAESESVVRKCVHCGFCTATCPTYVLLGDERDSPRGRIYLMKEMLETGRKPTAETVRHVDRCLSCLACMTTCPSSVNYMHLVDHARAYIHEHYARPWPDRAYRALLAAVLPHPARLRLALRLATLARFMAPMLKSVPLLRPLGAMLGLAPDRVPAPAAPRAPTVAAAKGRVAMLRGCAEPVLRPEFQEAAIRLLGRAGYQVVFAAKEGCCGSLVHHMGREDDGLAAVRRNVDAWTAAGLEDLEAIVVTASGCGTTIKEYGFMLRNDPAYAERAARVSALAADISEFLARIDLPPGQPQPLRVAYHAACSLQHGQKLAGVSKSLLERVGYQVSTPAEAHLCCGSAGVYNILQSEIADQLGDRKTANLEALGAQVIATGNIGCATQIGLRARVPVVHVVELLDAATGGPAPAALQAIIGRGTTP